MPYNYVHIYYYYHGLIYFPYACVIMCLCAHMPIHHDRLVSMLYYILCYVHLCFSALSTTDIYLHKLACSMIMCSSPPSHKGYNSFIGVLPSLEGSEAKMTEVNMYNLRRGEAK